ncbi:unnamed protein product [Gongylonema pulchrum]|uniref:Rad21_Rec8 domain-containing protein n=1 Tax=Gongylonema pulchrum TaxID=637853 RepID=A0A183CX96_9BILA|nr:unnamed protein product [Gongylonema pulchrum]
MGAGDAHSGTKDGVQDTDQMRDAHGMKNDVVDKESNKGAEGDVQKKDEEVKVEEETPKNTTPRIPVIDRINRIRQEMSFAVVLRERLKFTAYDMCKVTLFQISSPSDAILSPCTKKLTGRRMFRDLLSRRQLSSFVGGKLDTGEGARAGRLEAEEPADVSVECEASDDEKWDVNNTSYD